MNENRVGLGGLEGWLVSRRHQRFTKAVLALVTFVTCVPLFSFELTVVLMSIIATHEYGHVVAMRMCGVRTAGFYFIPLAGGIAIPLCGWRSLDRHVVIALGGAVAGAVATLALMLVYVIHPNEILGGVIWVSAVGNLSGLLPLPRMDGARCLGAIVFSLRGRDTAHYEPGSGWEDLIAVTCYATLVGTLLLIVLDQGLRHDAFLAWCHWRFLIQGTNPLP